MSERKIISFENLKRYNDAIQEQLTSKVAQDELSNLEINDIKNSPVLVDDTGKLNVIDEKGNIGLSLDNDGLYVKDVISGDHILSNKMDITKNLLGFTNTSISITDTPELSNAKQHISILFIGNSLTQDAVAYLPYLLKNYYPEIDFKIYLWYIGSATLNSQYNAFINGRNAAKFSIADNTENWITYSNKNMYSVLTTYKFDIVCFQDFYTDNSSLDHLADWNNCKNYIITNYSGGNPLKFINLLHAPRRKDTDNVDDMYELVINGNLKVLQETICEDIIPAGIAVYRALSTELTTLGDSGKLSPDGVHTQEGLPCLLQTFVIMLWLLDKLSIIKSIFGNSLRITDIVYNKISVPGANLGTGVITGTNEQNLLAQEIAIKSYKEGKKLVINNLYTNN